VDAKLNPGPKSRFLAYQPFVDAHLKLISLAEYQRAVDYALLQMLSDLTGGHTDGNTAAARYYELSGAVAFMNRMRNLGFPVPEKRSPKTEAEIDHKF
jgi:hypothetical protein